VDCRWDSLAEANGVAEGDTLIFTCIGDTAVIGARRRWTTFSKSLPQNDGLYEQKHVLVVVVSEATTCTF